MNILIAEDEFLIAFDLQLQLEGLGHTVIGIASDLASCQAILHQVIPDLAFMDLRLANRESGDTVAEWLLTTYGVRCVFMSGNLDASTRQRLETLEPVAMLGKPVFPNMISELVAGLGPET